MKNVQCNILETRFKENSIKDFADTATEKFAWNIQVAEKSLDRRKFKLQVCNYFFEKIKLLNE